MKSLAKEYGSDVSRHKLNRVTVGSSREALCEEMTSPENENARLFFAGIVAVLLFVAGCNVHPTPSQVSDLNQKMTYCFAVNIVSVLPKDPEKYAPPGSKLKSCILSTLKEYEIDNDATRDQSLGFFKFECIKSGNSYNCERKIQQKSLGGLGFSAFSDLYTINILIQDNELKSISASRDHVDDSGKVTLQFKTDWSVPKN